MEFRLIPPGATPSWVPTVQLSHVTDLPLNVPCPQIVEAKAGEQLWNVKPFTEEVRRNIDAELVDKSIDFIKRQKAAGKPFFLYCRSLWDTSQTFHRRNSKANRELATTATS
jgi:arylsulfatase